MANGPSISREGKEKEAPTPDRPPMRRATHRGDLQRDGWLTLDVLLCLAPYPIVWVQESLKDLAWRYARSDSSIVFDIRDEASLRELWVGLHRQNSVATVRTAGPAKIQTHIRSRRSL